MTRRAPEFNEGKTYTLVLRHYFCVMSTLDIALKYVFAAGGC